MDGKRKLMQGSLINWSKGETDNRITPVPKGLQAYQLNMEC